MLASGDVRHFQEWMQYNALEPFGDDWERTSLQTARTINTLLSIAAALGGKKLPESQLFPDDAFVAKLRSTAPAETGVHNFKRDWW